MAEAMKISAWLEQRVAYDEIYESRGLKEEFRTATGFTPPDWREEPLAAGFEHSTHVYVDVDVSRDQIVAYGIEIAQAIERTFVPGLRPEEEHYIGRGRNFSAIVASLRRAGL
jgi:hypothetical protein